MFQFRFLEVWEPCLLECRATYRCQTRVYDRRDFSNDYYREKQVRFSFNQTLY